MQQMVLMRLFLKLQATLKTRNNRSLFASRLRRNIQSLMRGICAGDHLLIFVAHVDLNLMHRLHHQCGVELIGSMG
jgi:hypothetical protein